MEHKKLKRKQTLDSNKKFLTSALLTLTVFWHSNLYSQNIRISDKLFGTNYWYFHKNAPSSYTDRFEDKIPDLRTAEINTVRIGGSYCNKTLVNVTDFDAYDHAIDNVLNMGATPILQLPINLSPADQITWVNHFNGKGIQFWAVGNEADPGNNWEDWHIGTYRENGNTYAEFVAKFKAIANVIKNASSTAIVVGPDFRHFWTDTQANDPLDFGNYYDDFIADVGTATVNDVPNGPPLLDFFVIHFYGSTTDTKIASRFAILKGYISDANAIRTGPDLGVAMGEVNADAASAAGITKPWDFAAGQNLGIWLKYIMKNSAKYFCTWSPYESSGNHGSTDFSLYNTDGTRRSTIEHIALLSQNRRDFYMNSYLNKSSFSDKIVVVGMTDRNGSTVMIMNTTPTAYTYSAKLNNTYSAAVVDVKIKLATKNLNSTEWIETIPANTTIVYTVSAAGTLLNKYVYDATMTTGPTLTVLAVGPVSPNPSSDASTNAIKRHNEVKIFPVPVESKLNVENATNFKSIRIYNNVGQMVYTISNPNQDNVKIDLSPLAPGIYYMHLKGISKTLVKKLIKP